MVIVIAALLLSVLLGALFLIPRDRKFEEVYLFHFFNSPMHKFTSI